MTNVDTRSLISDNFVDSANELLRIVDNYPFRPSERKSGESSDLYENRAEAEHMEWKAGILANVERGARQGVLMILRNYFESGQWKYSQLLDNEGFSNPSSFIASLLDHVGLSNDWSREQQRCFIQFLTKVIPALMKYQSEIPELKSNGGVLSDDLFMAIFDQSGYLTLPRIIYRAIALVNRFNEDMGPEIARTITVALLTQDVDLIESVSSISQAIATEARRVKLDHPSWSSSQVAAEVGSTKDAVQKYLKEKDGVEKMGGQVRWVAEETGTVTIVFSSRAEYNLLMAKIRNYVELV